MRLGAVLQGDGLNSMAMRQAPWPGISGRLAGHILCVNAGWGSKLGGGSLQAPALPAKS